MAKKKKNTALDSAAAIRGLDRKAHFEAGGSLTGINGWRAIRTVTPDRKKKASKKACRGKVQW